MYRTLKYQRYLPLRREWNSDKKLVVKNFLYVI